MQTTAIDWSQIWYPGPRRAFSADEMARAGSDAPSPTLVVIAFINATVFVVLVLLFAPPAQTGLVALLFAGLGGFGFWAARWLWWRPWRRPLMAVSISVVVVMIGLGLAIRAQVPEGDERRAVAMVLALGCGSLPTLLWFLVVWRAHQIEARLREQAERERAVEMARRLAAAQLEPHFLFNTLASLQHWVHTRDARAAPMLDALVGYLRATLPMFDRPQQTVAAELEAVRLYLEVIAARFGERLRYRIDVPPPLQALPLPPGLLLTLVENAVEHGIEPSLHGGSIGIEARREGDEVVLEVHDDGPGPPAALHDGIGLANCRERLALAYGGAARLDIRARAAGGCSATLRVHWQAPR